MTPVVVTQRDPSLIRGRLPGAYESLHGRVLNNLDIIDNVQGLPGRKFMCLYGNTNYQGWGTSWGHVMIDITGPWDS
jgi:hypothetical protein